MINQDKLFGSWLRLKGRILKEWGKLTSDDVEKSQGDAQLLIGKIAERYDIGKEKAEKKLDEYLEKFYAAKNSAIWKAGSLFGMLKGVSTPLQIFGKNCQKFSKKNPKVTVGIVAALVGLLLCAALKRPGQDDES